MSLASRLANILLPNQAAHLAPSNDEPHIAFSDGSLTAPDSSHAQESRKKSKSTDMEEEEAMGRKPYVHVRPDKYPYHENAEADSHVVHDRRWPGWYHG